MKIRMLKENDMRQASKIVGQNYSRKYEKLSFVEMGAMFKDNIGKPQYLVVEEKGEILGVAGYIQSWMDYNIYHIFWVNIAPMHQGKGIGTALVQKVITIIKKKNADMILLTTSKPKYYSKKFGFKAVSTFHTGEYKLMALKLKE